MQTSPKVVILAVLSALFVIVLLQNTSVITLRFLFWDLSMSQIILIPLITGIGFVVGYFVGKSSW